MLDLAKITEHFAMGVARNEIAQEFYSEADRAAHKENSGEDTHAADSPPDLVWPEDILPPTEYTKRAGLRGRSRIEELGTAELSDIRPKRLALFLHCIDLLLIEQISAQDLMRYDGCCIPVSIAHAQNKNTGMLRWLSAEADFRYLRKMMAESTALQNYNMLNVLLRCAQGRPLKPREMARVVEYRAICDRTTGGIFPLEWLLKDCADSNVNVSSEIASMRFCQIVVRLKEMRGTTPPQQLRERHKQLVYGRIWAHLRRHTTRPSKTKDKAYHGLFLVL